MFFSDVLKYCVMLQAFIYAIVLTSVVYDACVCVCVCVCVRARVCVCYCSLALFSAIEHVLLTWKSAIEIKSLLLTHGQLTQLRS